MTRPLVLCLALTSCLQPPTEPPDVLCTEAVASSCNELATGANAGVCEGSACRCLAGFELGPTGKCRPVALCPMAPQQPGQGCTNPGLTCRYGDANPLCGSRTVRCIGTAWLEVEHSDPQPGCGPDAGTCTGAPPTCVMGTPGGLCGDAALAPSCVQRSWVCPASTIPSTQCACSGNRGPTCTCTPGGWSCVSDAGTDAGVCPADCSEGDAGVGGVCSAGTCLCNPGFVKNPATGRCGPAQACGIRQVTAATPLTCPRTVGEFVTPAAGLCPTGFFPIRDYACGPPFPLADGGVSCTNCSVMPIQLSDAGISDQRCVEECTCTNRCTTGRCLAFPIFWGDDTQTSTVRLCL